MGTRAQRPRARHDHKRELRHFKDWTQPFWGGPEQTGRPPMHETTPEVAEMLSNGWIKHFPGEGYLVTEAGVEFAFSQDNHPVGDIVAAISEFQAAFPDWWFSMGTCRISAHASCGPQNEEDEKRFGSHFDCDNGEPGATMADALRDVMRQALEKKRSA